MTRVLVVDDHAIVRDGLRRLLKERAETEVLEAASGEIALEIQSALHLDLIILDLNLPGVGGLEIVRRLVRGRHGCPILVFSQLSAAIYAVKSLEAGARGFMSKNAMPDELLEAIDVLLGGGVAVEQAIQREIASHDLLDDPYLKPLNEREVEILRLLAEGGTISDIAGHLGIAYKTVANALSRIKEKLGVGQTADLIRIALTRGLADLTSSSV
jgi:two-component system invasion response regulator UvrY